MEQEDNQSFAQFLLLVTGALISYIITIMLQGPFYFQIFIITIVIFIAFIVYTSLIGRPWPRSYYKIIECEGTESDIESFFWVFYNDFESTLKQYFSNKIAELNPAEDFPHLILEHNKIKVESENRKTLDLTCNLIKDLYDLNGMKNIQIGKLNIQNKYIARIRMNYQFRTSTTNIIFATKLNLNELDMGGIHNTSKILELETGGENALTIYSWQEKKYFIPIKNQIQQKHANVFHFVKKIFNAPDTPNYPIIHRRQIILDELNKQLVYYVTIDAKWNIPHLKSIVLFKDAIENFHLFLNIWDNTNPKAGVKYRFKNCTFSGLIIQDGIISKNYAKRLTFFSDKYLE